MEEVLDGIECLRPARGDILLGVGLELLPSVFPEPGLVPVHYLLGDQDDSIVDDL